MKHISGALTTAGAVLVLALSTAGIAHAAPATGDFIYTSPDGQRHRLHNPENNRCYVITGVAFTRNDTDVAAETFRNSTCSGTFGELFPPGASEERSDFQSVKFGRPI
ncbi:hypothetical protein [Nocardia sp. NPDC049149]|uniref:hypothetical protein n=1 Tax=Nocardia sp. NPDC049149 TaxID=3364315 RepID=UPI003723A44D